MPSLLTADGLRALCEVHQPETPSLEFKSELAFSDKREVLKDLTGMGNAGGGTLIYGIRDRKINGEDAADAIQPLTDRMLPGRLDDLVRDAVRPPLVWRLGTVEVDGGFVLVAEVQRSTLGPYMIETGNERRYYTRHGTSNVLMYEREVRDHYALAVRTLDRRAEVWAEHGLPWSPGMHTWTHVSGIPLDPLTDAFDMTTTEPDTFSRSDPAFSAYTSAYADPGDDLIYRWGQGFYAVRERSDGEPDQAVSLFRDGAAQVSRRMNTNTVAIPTVTVLRQVNAALLYLGWFWTRIGLRRPIELRIELSNIAGELTFNHVDEPVNQTLALKLVRSPTTPTPSWVRHNVEVLGDELTSAPTRHRILSTFADRFAHALGRARADVPIRRGVLYGRDGAPLPYSVSASLLHEDKRGVVATIDTDGAVTATSTGRLACWFADGLLADLDGDVLGVVEFPTARNCPADFVAHPSSNPAGGVREFGTQPAFAPNGLAGARPTTTGRWSAASIGDLVFP